MMFSKTWQFVRPTNTMILPCTTMTRMLSSSSSFAIVTRNITRKSRQLGGVRNANMLSTATPPTPTPPAGLGTNRHHHHAYRDYPKYHRGFSSSSNNSPATTNDSNNDLATTSSDGVVGLPIDFDVASKVEGNESQIVTVMLEPGQVLRAESGALMYMTEGVEMNTTTGGGMSAGLKRLMTGQNIFISDYTYQGDSKGMVALGTDFPSKIIRLNLEEYGGKIVAQKGALLCCSHTVDIEMEFAKKMTAGFFGGEGFVLQSLTGQGDVFVKAGGTLIKKELQEGEQLRTSSGCLVAFSSEVDFDVQMMSGFKNVMFGGEGLFVTTLTGPGTVWLQGQPPERMVSEIARRVPSGGIGLAVPIPGMGGGSGGEGGEDGGGEAPQ